MRRPGDWYFSVKGVDGREAEFEMMVILREPPDPPEVFRCNRFEWPCPVPHYHGGDVLPSSAARAAGSGTRRERAAVAAVLACSTWLLRRRPRTR